MNGLNNLIKLADAAGRSSYTKIAAILILAWAIAVVAMAIGEGVKAFRETRERQRRLHPDPEAEREYVRYILELRELERRERSGAHDEAAGYAREARTFDTAEVTA